VPVEQTHGARQARGATIGGSQVHSIRLPGYVLAFETVFGLPNERLTIRHDAGKGAAPYVHGTLLAVRRVMQVVGFGTRPGSPALSGMSLASDSGQINRRETACAF
jgi:4-hydroxy-tetrahydrodipicolinate reductase